MKKILILGLMILFSIGANAQYKHEVKYNFLNTIIMGSAEIGYEYFLDEDQSLGLDVLINDRFSYFPEKGSSHKKFNTNSVMLSYNLYLSTMRNGSGYYLTPFVKYRFGDFEEQKDDYIVKTDMNSFILGLGTGYKWNFKDKLAVGPFVNVGRNFSKEVNDRFNAVEFNAGISLGYRF